MERVSEESPTPDNAASPVPLTTLEEDPRSLEADKEVEVCTFSQLTSPLPLESKFDKLIAMLHDEHVKEVSELRELAGNFKPADSRYSRYQQQGIAELGRGASAQRDAKDEAVETLLSRNGSFLVGASSRSALPVSLPTKTASGIESESYGKSPLHSLGDDMSEAGKRADARTRTYRVLKNLTTGSWGDRVAKKFFENVTAKVRNKEGRTSSRSFGDYARAKGWRKEFSFNSVGRTATTALVESVYFDVFCSAIIIGNAMFVGFIADYTAHTVKRIEDLPLYFLLIDRLFSAWFLIELLLRISARGFCHFLLSAQWRWNWFDTLVVATDMVDFCASIAARNGSRSLSNLTVARILRVLRIARAVRVVRLIRFFKELRLMVASVLRSGASLMWAIVMLSIIIFFFSVYLMQNVTYAKLEEFQGVSKKDAEVLEDSFGSLLKSCYTLFQAVSGGVSWVEVTDPLISLHWTNCFVFCFYVFFTLFAMLNIVTGIFVDSAINSAQNDHEEMIQEAIHNQDSTMRRLQKIFVSADSKGNGLLTFEEFEQHLEDHTVRGQLSAMGLDVTEARGIFKLLDLDGSGLVSIEEFVFGCLRLAGHAKTIDLMSLIYENKRMAERWMSLFQVIVAEQTRHERFEQRHERFERQQEESALRHERFERSFERRMNDLLARLTLDVDARKNLVMNL